MTDYERRLQEALTKQANIKEEIAFLRLQIKQEVKQTKWAKGSPDIKELSRLYPDLRIDNGAGTTYMGLTRSVLDVPVQLPAGWELFESHPQDPSTIGSPVVNKYRFKGLPALLYVTKAVR